MRISRRRAVLVALAATLAGLGGLAAFVVRAIVADIPPPDLSDLALERRVVRPEENGFFLVDFDGESIVEDEDYPVWRMAIPDLWDPAKARTLIEKNAAPLEAWEKSLELPEFQVPETDDGRSSYLPGWHAIGGLIDARITLLLDDGKVSEGIDETFRRIRFGRRVVDSEGGVTTFTVGTGWQRSGLTNVREIVNRRLPGADDLRRALGELGDLRPTDGGVRDVIGSWLRLVRKLGLDREEALRMAASLEEPASLLCPNETLALCAQAYRTAITNIGRKPAERTPIDRPENQSLSIGGLRIPLSLRNRAGKSLLWLVVDGIERTIATYDQARVDFELTRALVALRLWHLEHGSLPPTLDDLVPDYLPAVPVDPYDGKPLRYSREWRLLWSVGEDLRDDGGSLEADLTAPIEWE